MIRNLVAAFTLCLSLVAAPLSWNVSGSFADGGTLSGQFTFDDTTGTVSSWNVGVSGGNTATFPDFTYSTDPVGVSYNTFLLPETQFAFFDPGSPRRLILSTSSPLTGAGGVISLISFIDSTNFSGECFNCNPFRYLSNGQLTSRVSVDSRSPVPEPSSWMLVGAGTAVLVASRLQRGSRGASEARTGDIGDRCPR